jgi:hypothetical protein
MLFKTPIYQYQALINTKICISVWMLKEYREHLRYVSNILMHMDGQYTLEML